LQTGHFQLEGDPSQGKNPAGIQQISLAGDWYAVDLGAVGTAQILNKPIISFPLEPSVMTRDLWIVNNYVTIAPAPEE
jgi:hypothetical protein